MQDHDLRYPIGPFKPPEQFSKHIRNELLKEFASIPAKLRKVINKIPTAKIDTPWRPGGWTIRQVVHHLADSHMNGFIRCKLALTQETPHILLYSQPDWAACADSLDAPVSYSIDLLTSLHVRWTILFESLDSAGWQKTYLHPEMGEFSLANTLALYAWHGSHHTAQLQSWLDGKTGTSP